PPTHLLPLSLHAALPTFPMWNMPPTSDPLWQSIELGPYPAGAGGEPLIQVFTDWLSVPAYVEDVELATEFLKFITSRENAIALRSEEHTSELQSRENLVC